MQVFEFRELPVEPTELRDGLKWSYRDPSDRRKKIRAEFHSEFRLITRDQWGDEVDYDIFGTFDDALRDFRDQIQQVDFGAIASVEIEVVLRWDDAEGLVEWEEIEIYHYGRREYADPHSED